MALLASSPSNSRHESVPSLRIARLRPGAGALVFGLVAVSMLLGCQPKRQDSVAVQGLPAPNFDGKAIAQAPPPAPAPVRPAPPPREPVQIGGIPREWVPTVQARPWRWIVIHHSATPGGNAAIFTRMHLNNGWDELGYHFVIGNGTDSGNGQVEIGSRWPKQKWGAHAKTADNRYNDFGIGICLVGNFENERPSQQQMQALARLTAYLMQTYRIPAERVIGHSDTRATDCPGRYMNIAELRRMATRMVAEAGSDPVPLARPAGELMTDR